MDLTPYLDALRRDLTSIAAPGAPEVVRAAELLGGSLDASARLCLMEALSDAAAQITAKLRDVATVDVRLRGREAEFVVTDLAAAASAAAAVPAPAADASDVTRITLRLPEHLKERVERAAATEAISVNAWLVRAVGAAVGGGAQPGPVGPAGPSATTGRRRVTGFAQA
jgi:predicted HicB family RNase H-like nuclease